MNDTTSLPKSVSNKLKAAFSDYGGRTSLAKRSSTTGTKAAMLVPKANDADVAMLRAKMARQANKTDNTTAALIGNRNYKEDKLALKGANARIIEGETAAFSRLINQLFSEDDSDKENRLQHLLPIDDKSRELFDKLKDGMIVSMMLNAVEVKEHEDDIRGIAGKAVNMKKMNKAPKNPWQFSENLNRAISAASKLGCVTVNMGSEDIINKNETLCLGLIWQVARMKLVQNITLQNCPFLLRLRREGETIKDLLKLSPEELLLRWFNYHLSRSTEHKAAAQQITNFGGDLRDSTALTTLVRQLQWQLEQEKSEELREFSNVKDLVEGELAGVDHRDRAQAVIDEAFDAFGVRTFIAADDICAGNARLNLAFVAQIFNKCPGLTATEEEIAMLRNPLTSQNRNKCRKAFGQMRQVALEYRSATDIQATYCGHVQRTSFLHTLKCVIMVQALARGRAQQQAYTAAKAAAVLIQAVYRGYVCHTQYQRALRSAVLIQATYRSYAQRVRYQQTRTAAATRVQTAYRGHVNRVQYKNAVRSAILIQATYRGHVQRTSFLHTLKCVIMVQALARGRAQQQAYTAAKAAAVLIQAVYRGYVCRAQYQRALRSAVLIQATYRGYAQRVRYGVTMLRAAVIRAARNADRREVLARNTAAAFLQATYRGHVQRTSFLHTLKCVIMVQALARGRAQRHAFAKAKAAAVTIQRMARGMLARSRNSAGHRAAVRVQTAYRRHAQRTRYLAVVCGVVRIQAAYRGYAVRAVQYYGFLKKQNASGRGLVSSMKKCFFLFHAGRLYYSTVYGLNTMRELLSFSGCTVKNLKSVVVRGVADWEGKGALHSYKHGLELAVDGEVEYNKSRTMHLCAPTAAEKAVLRKVIETSIARAAARAARDGGDGEGGEEVQQQMEVSSRVSVTNFRDAKFVDVAEECAEYFKKVKEAKKKKKEAAAQAAAAAAAGGANGRQASSRRLSLHDAAEEPDDTDVFADTVDINQSSFFRQSRGSLATRNSLSRASTGKATPALAGSAVPAQVAVTEAP